MADLVKVSEMDDVRKTKFIHSIKLPKIYKVASKVLKQVSQRERSFKNAFYDNVQHNRHKAVYALVRQTMKYNTIIEELIDSSSLANEDRLDRDIAKVLICELLFGKKSLSGDSKPILKILEKKRDLEKGLKRILKKNHVDNVDSLSSGVSLPIYVRINTLKTTIEKFISCIEFYDCFERTYRPETTYEEFIQLVKSLEVGFFLRDFHIPDLLIFQCGTVYQTCDFYKESKIIIQDKGSCFPAMLLNPPPGSTVVDACAAPGMKTTQLAALMENNGQILAVEKEKERMEILKSNLSKSNVSCATTFCEDFIRIDPTEEPFCNAEYILVDPSCSGSGMANRLIEGSATTTDNSHSRLSKLANFQTYCLNHALSFPNVKRIVYSTCSLYTEENEAVLTNALSAHGNKFRLSKILPEWPRRGIKEKFKKMSRAVRTDPHLDLTGGFFIAVIERKNDS